MSESRFDFLRELVKNIPDINVAEEQQCDSYPERRESSEDGMASIESIQSTLATPATAALTAMASHANGVASNPNGGTAAWLKANQRDGGANASASSSSSSSSSSSGSANIHPHWKFSKQHSIDSLINKNQNIYSAPSNDGNTPINYSIKIKLDDNKPTPAKLLRMESTPASFGSNSNLASPIVTSNYLPLTATTTTKNLPDGDTQPIINFDFSKIPLLPSTAMAAVSTPQTATAPTNHSHSVTNLLNRSDNPPHVTAGDTAKNEVSVSISLFRMQCSNQLACFWVSFSQSAIINYYIATSQTNVTSICFVYRNINRIRNTK